MICRSEKRRCSHSRMGGWMNRQKNGIAASRPMPALPQPSAFTAKPITNGKFPSVRFSIGTLKQLSIVHCLSDSSSSRLRSGFMGGRET